MSQRGESCAALAARIGRSKGLIGHLQSGRRPTCSYDTADRLAKAYDLATDDLFWPKVS